jgi:hypothetical protein
MTDRPGRAALVCYRNGITISAECTFWDNRDQARLAEAELTRCGPAVHRRAQCGCHRP